MTELPRYDELPQTERGVRTGWGLFGEQDSVGLMSQLTPAVIRGAVGLVRRGDVFPLDAPLNFFDPPLFERPALRRETQPARGGWGFNEVIHDFNPQSSSQWDALAHVSFELNAFYNGATIDDVLERGRDTIDHWARRGIVGRGVLLDLRRAAADRREEFDPGSSHAFSVADLEDARRRAGVEYQAGDILVLRTGFVEWYGEQDAAERARISSREELRACGVEHTEDMARYLWDAHFSAVASDCPALEVWPMDHRPELWPFGCLHQILLGQFGMAIGELWWLEALAAECAADGVHEFLLTSAPLNSPGGFGSPANALAIR